MAGELERVLGSIDLSLNSKESKYRELATLQQLDNQKDLDDQKEQQSQLAYQQYEESVNQFSDTLLENDRDAIRQVHQESKGFIREQLQMHGGSYKKFMANGGLRVMANYKNSITGSDEAKRYQSNSKNMARIIQARDAGKASLISKQDLYSLNKYETEGGGEITYSGLLSPIEQIDAGAFTLGENIPAERILRYGNNHSAIMGNYMRENPEKGTPSMPELLKYTQQKYASTGKNQAMLQYSNRSNKAKGSIKAADEQYSIYTTTDKAFQVINVNADGSAGFKVNDKDAGVKNYERGRKAYGNVISNKKFTNTSTTEVDTGLISGWFNDIDETRPLNAYELSGFNGSFNTAAKEIYKQYYNAENNKYNIPASQLKGANGSSLDIDDDDQILTLTPKTVILAQTGKGKQPLSNSNNEEEFMVVEFADKNGKLDNKNNQRYIDSIRNPKTGEPLNVQYKPWQVFEDSQGKLFYKQMDMESESVKQAYTSAIKGQDDYKESIKAKQTIERKEQSTLAVQQFKNKQVKAQVDAVYNNSSFTHGVYKNIIVNNKLAKKPNIFESMIIGTAMANAQLKSEPLNLSVNTLNLVSEQLSSMIPESSINGLRNANLTMADAYMGMKKGMMEEAENEEDKKQVNLFLDFWEQSYKSKTGEDIFKNKKQ
jgi:hypothetical protein